MFISLPVIAIIIVAPILFYVLVDFLPAFFGVGLIIGGMILLSWGWDWFFHNAPKEIQQAVFIAGGIAIVVWLFRLVFFPKKAVK